MAVIMTRTFVPVCVMLLTLAACASDYEPPPPVEVAPGWPNKAAPNSSSSFPWPGETRYAPPPPAVPGERAAPGQPQPYTLHHPAAPPPLR